MATTLPFLSLPAAAQEDWSYYARRAFSEYLEGDYEGAEDYCERVMSFGSSDPDLTRVLLEAQSAQGKYEEAAAVAARASEAFEGYFPIQILAIHTLRQAGRVEKAEEVLKGLDQLAKETNPKTLNAPELTALGEAALLLGAEPKMVLANFFEKARQLDPKILDAHLAAADLALSKADYLLASRILNEARTKVGSLPDILYRLAVAFSPSDRRKAEELIDELLEINSRHVPALLLRAEHALDAEQYERAREGIAQARDINPRHPRAWALEAAIAFILDQKSEGEAAREKALEPWEGNPEVDFWIGEKISQNRRFAEGTAFLRKALEADPGHLDAKKALGQNLLRLGKEEEGWALIKEVRAADEYDVEAYNLMLLHDELQSFVTLEDDKFAVRMTSKEAAVYGPRVLELLASANETLGAKYGYLPSDRIVVDFFPDQQDFAIRTLGMPGGIGILGACFGNVIAMNSPGSAGAMGTNWESTLWHEYCHTLTLGATRSRIPRWLTEGISVFEERNRDAACGHKMTPAFRRRILANQKDDAESPALDDPKAAEMVDDPFAEALVEEEPVVEEVDPFAEDDEDASAETDDPAEEVADPFAEAEADTERENENENENEEEDEEEDEDDAAAPGLIPIKHLSAALTAFNDPPTIDFAYYQASLLVEYLLETYGAETFQEVLNDLQTNAAAEEVLANRMAPPEELDAGFAKFARARAEQTAPEADWTLPDPDSPIHRDPEGVARYLAENPNSIWALTTHCQFLLAEEKWSEAKASAQKLIEIYPGFVGPGNGYGALALACRNLGQHDEEREALRQWTSRDGDASAPLDRLIELDLEREDWPAVLETSRRLLAVNPMLRSPHRALGVAAQAEDLNSEAIRAFESLVSLEPVNPADVHYRLAQLHHAEAPQSPQAKRHILTAIEEAPRFREAHQLLLELAPPDAPDDTAEESGTPSEPPAPTPAAQP